MGRNHAYLADFSTSIPFVSPLNFYSESLPHKFVLHLDDESFGA